MKRLLLSIAAGLLATGTAQAGLVGGDALIRAHDVVLLENRARLTAFELHVPEVAQGFSLNFTPRHGSGISWHNRFEIDVGEVGMSVGLVDMRAGRGDAEPRNYALWSRLQDGSVSSSFNRRLMIGGALHYEQWQLGSGYAQTDVFGSRTELWSAHVGYGGLKAGVAFGQHDTQTELRDVMMLNTGVDALSWLRLYGDVAISRGQEEDSIAVGRVGVRLNF